MGCDIPNVIASLRKTFGLPYRSINSALLTTIGACGDVNRNVMCSSIPTQSKLHAEVYRAAKAISNRLLPSTSAYHEVTPVRLLSNPTNLNRSGFRMQMGRNLRLLEMLFRILNPCMGQLTCLESIQDPKLPC